VLSNRERIQPLTTITEVNLNNWHLGSLSAYRSSNDTCQANCPKIEVFFYFKSLSQNGETTAFVQRLKKNKPARCGVAAKYALNIKYSINSVHTTSPQRRYSIPGALTVSKKLLQRVHGALTARTYSDEP